METIGESEECHFRQIPLEHSAFPPVHESLAELD
jgi:hypothetical protein